MIEQFKAGAKMAGFGSRETPKPILDFMEVVAGHVAGLGGVVASGHCLGADLSFEQGAARVNPSRVSVHLPWANYNRDLPCPAGAFVEVLTDLPADERAALMTEAQRYHGAWQRLTSGGRLLHTRNLLIGRRSILGVCYLNHSKPGGGGSGQCFRYLTSKGVPVYDLARPGRREALVELLGL